MHKSLRIPAICASVALLAACAGAAGPSNPPEELQCPVTQVVVCTGGTVSKIGNTSRRDPLFCDCRDRDEVNL